MIVITGASSGLGKAIYEYLSQKGFKVIGISRRGPDIKADLTVYDERVRVVQELDGIEVLVNNAGMMLLEEDPKDATAYEMLLLNLVAVWHLSLLLSDKIPSGGKIINIASVSGIKGEKDLPLYAATKAGVIALTKSFAMRLVEKGVTVNCISPGLFDTNLVPFPAPDELIESIPMKREAQPEELLPAVEMILSSDYMTGANIVVDGGHLL